MAMETVFLKLGRTLENTYLKIKKTEAQRLSDLLKVTVPVCGQSVLELHYIMLLLHVIG